MTGAGRDHGPVRLPKSSMTALGIGKRREIRSDRRADDMWGVAVEGAGEQESRKMLNFGNGLCSKQQMADGILYNIEHH